jgi:hypothetical protein
MSTSLTNGDKSSHRASTANDGYRSAFDRLRAAHFQVMLSVATRLDYQRSLRSVPYLQVVSIFPCVRLPTNLAISLSLVASSLFRIGAIQATSCAKACNIHWRANTGAIPHSSTWISASQRFIAFGFSHVSSRYFRTIETHFTDDRCFAVQLTWACVSVYYNERQLLHTANIESNHAT